MIKFACIGQFFTLETQKEITLFSSLCTFFCFYITIQLWKKILGWLCIIIIFLQIIPVTLRKAKPSQILSS